MRFSPRRKKWSRTLPALAAAAAALVLLVARPWQTTYGSFLNDSPFSDILLKGDGPHLVIYRQAEGQASHGERLKNASLGHRGDLLQLRYAAMGYPYGMIFSLDGRGKVTLHFPADANQSTALKAGGEVALPYSYELDDAPNFERFFLVAAGEPLPVAAILSKAEAASKRPEAVEAALALPAGAKLSIFTVTKAEAKP